MQLIESLNHLPIISLIIGLPVLASFCLIFLNQKNGPLFTLVIFAINFLLSLAMLSQFDMTNSHFQFIDKFEWISNINVFYMVGVDGISVLFLPFSNLLFMAVVLSSWRSIKKLSNLYYAMLLLLATATLGIFSAIDTISFFLFWELTLIPIYFLISLWGVGANRRFAAGQYTLFMLIGGLPILFAFVLLAVNGAEGHYVFNYIELVNHHFSESTQLVVFFLLLIGFAVKTPIFPFHAWLPLVAMEGPAGVAAIMTGMKLGIYGLLRFTMPLAPDVSNNYHWLLAALGVIGMLYGAIVALRQTNIRKMLAYASISHVGLVVLGLASINVQGIQGAVFQLLNFSLIASALFLMTGFIYQRFGSTEIRSLGGLGVKMPLFVSFFFILGMGSLGVPGTSAFPAELLLIMSALQTHTGAGITALVVIVISATYFLNIYQKAFLGPINNNDVNFVMDLTPRELTIVFSFASIVIIIGFFPELLMQFISSSTEQWVLRFK